MTDEELIKRLRQLRHGDTLGGPGELLMRDVATRLEALSTELRRLRQIEDSVTARYHGPMPPGLGANGNIDVDPNWKYEFLPGGGYRMVPRTR